MKNLNPIKTILIISILSVSEKSIAQTDVGALFKSGPEDATKLINAYFNPLYKGLGVGLSDGWTNTAKSKGFLRFEVRVSAGTAFVPSADQSYNANALGLRNIRPAAGSDGIGPTAFGNDADGARMQVYTSDGLPTTTFFNLPKGLGFHVVPSAQIQATLGLPKNIDITLRAMPKVKLGSDLGDLSMIGIGAKVEILPLLLGSTEKLIPVDIAVAGGFTRYTYHLPINVNNTANSDQRISAKFNGLNVDAIVSKQIAFFTPFASVGYQSSQTDLRALGTYQFDTGNGTSVTYVDPIAVKQTDVDGMRASIGFQLRFGFFKFFSSYTAAKYDLVNAGIAFGTGQ